MVLSIDLFKPVSQPCDLCGWLDDAGGVRLEDDSGARRVFCNQCTLDLVKACLGLPHGIAVTAPPKTGRPVAGESRRPAVAKAS
jgi:hypothetical protein